MYGIQKSHLAIWQKWCFGQFYHPRIEVLQNCSASFCLSISRETKTWGNERISFSKNPNLGVLFGGPLPPSEGGLLDVGDDGLGLPSRLGVDGAVLTSIGLFTMTDWDLPLIDEALEDEGLLHIDEKNLLISQHGIPSIIFMSFSTIQLKCTFFKNEVELCSVEHICTSKNGWIGLCSTEQCSSSFLKNVHL